MGSTPVERRSSRVARSRRGAPVLPPANDLVRVPPVRCGAGGSEEPSPGTGGPASGGVDAFSASRFDRPAYLWNVARPGEGGTVPWGEASLLRVRSAGIGARTRRTGGVGT